jgi:copper chaperone CopZ
MRKLFKVLNVKCAGCATTLKNTLREDFGEVEVNLEVTPREIELDIEEERIEALKTTLRKVGYPLECDEMSSFDATKLKAKSFVSCAVGKFQTEDK